MGKYRIPTSSFFLIISRSLAAICLFPIFPSRSSFLRSAAVLSAVLLLCNNTNAPFIAVAALVYFALSDTVVGSLWYCFCNNLEAAHYTTEVFRLGHLSKCLMDTHHFLHFHQPLLTYSLWFIEVKVVKHINKWSKEDASWAHPCHAIAALSLSASCRRHCGLWLSKR